jgi:threonine dehydratase
MAWPPLPDDAPHGPDVAAIREARATLGARVHTTPVWPWTSPTLAARLGPTAQVWLKLELLQVTGTFKARGALLHALALTAEARARGVTTVSAGNHAMALAYAAQATGTTAKVVMPETSNPGRVAGCRAYGAEVVLVPSVHAAFAEVQRIVADEGRTFVHPFEGPVTALGTATVGLELAEQVQELDAVIIPIGGGGLCAGMATAIRALQPSCEIIGVEPEGADTMHRSFAAGSPQTIAAIRTIADSLGAPMAAPYSFALCRRAVDRLVLVDDAGLRAAMALMFRELKLACEPAAAAAACALLGPLAPTLRDRRVGVLVCGSNIDIASFHAQVAAAEPDVRA